MAPQTEQISLVFYLCTQQEEAEVQTLRLFYDLLSGRLHQEYFIFTSLRNSDSYARTYLDKKVEYKNGLKCLDSILSTGIVLDKGSFSLCIVLQTS